MLALAAVTLALLGRPVPVTCYPLAQLDALEGAPAGTAWVYDSAGFYDWGHDRIGLLNATCRLLGRLGTRKPMTVEEANAAFSLAHELGHASGIVDERLADCYGAAHASQVAWLLGLRSRAAFLELADFIHWYSGYNPGTLPCRP